MMRMRSIVAVAMLLAVIGAVAGPAAAPQDTSVPAAPAPVSLPPPLPAGPAPDLDLVFTAEVAGYVEPCG